MDSYQLFLKSIALAPIAFMVVVSLLTRLQQVSTERLWKVFLALSGSALVLTCISAAVGTGGLFWPGLLRTSVLSQILGILVQVLGTIIGGFSARYLEGEAGQRRYIAALAAVLASVHLLLMADHWLILIAAWAAVGMAMQHLLCFYPERPFAGLAAHKKQMADRVADALLLGAGALAWLEIGSGSLSDLWPHLEQFGVSASLQLSAVGLVLAVIIRTALLPVHGWLIQVMEAPTPVSALLHAGVINLGGFVLIRFAPLLEQAAPARVLLLVFSLVTVLLAGMVMLTRISIKVRLAWSTVAQMGFMLLECALGLYVLAALHLIGHSLYKAHAFLSASSIVRQTRVRALRGPSLPAPFSFVVAPVLAISVVLLMNSFYRDGAWPWWWSAALGLAWAPFLWLPVVPAGMTARIGQVLFGLLLVAGLTLAAMLFHSLPLGVKDSPHQEAGFVAVLGMAALYFCLALLRLRQPILETWRRWSYAGFYVDEAYTRLALRLWPGDWTRESRRSTRPKAIASEFSDASR